MIYDTFGGVTSSNQDLFDRLFGDDMRPRIIKAYLAECPHCGDRFPYHPELFPTCGNPDCSRVSPASSETDFPLHQSQPVGN
jgi:hypothetical protein